MAYDTFVSIISMESFQKAFMKNSRFYFEFPPNPSIFGRKFFEY